MAEFDAYRSTYDTQINAAIAFSGKSLDFFTRVKAEYLSEILDAAFPGRDAIDVLDVGCGHGIIHGPLLEEAPRLRLRGIDVAGEVIAEARQSHPGIDYDVYDGSRLPYEDDRFDAAFTICVMHHVPPPQWQGFLAEMRRVVRPGGLVVVFEHNPLNPGTRYIVNTCPIDKDAVLLRRGRLTELARGAGLQDVVSRFILFTPFAGALFKGIDRQLGRVPFGAQYYVTGRVAGPGTA